LGLRAIEQRSRPIVRGSSSWVRLICTLFKMQLFKKFIHIN
jgi:hypothetical protein